MPINILCYYLIEGEHHKPLGHNSMYRKSTHYCECFILNS
nr:MAG TPA: hypothetical protein [Caudoviricetes sp.]